MFVHQRQPRVAVAVRGTDRLQFTEQRVQVRASWVAAAEVLVQRAGLADRVERRVGDEPVDLAADEQPLLAVELGPLNGALAVLRFDVAGEGVDGLVVVVVAVEVLEGKPAIGDILSGLAVCCLLARQAEDHRCDDRELDLRRAAADEFGRHRSRAGTRPGPDSSSIAMRLVRPAWRCVRGEAA